MSRHRLAGLVAGFALVMVALYLIMPRIIPNPPTGGSETDGVLNLTFSLPIQSLDPYSLERGSQHEIFSFIYSNLAIPLDEGGFAPDLATAWEESNEGKIWRLALRPNARFHDGRPVTADDVAFSIHLMSNNNPALAEVIQNIECPSMDVVIVHLTRPLPSFFYQVSVECIVPRPLPGAPGLDAMPVGSGPFKVDFREGNRRLVLSRHAGYHGPSPQLEGIDIVYEPDDERAWLDFMHDDVHASLTISPENVRLMRFSPGKYRLEGRYDRKATVLVFNLRDSLFQDLDLRRAISQMLNITEHIQSDLKGMAVPGQGPLGIFSEIPTRFSGSPAYDGKEAAALLHTLGWADADGDGCLERDGRTLEFSLLVSDTDPLMRDTAVYIQRTLNRFGIRVHPEFKRFDRIMEENVQKKTFQSFLVPINTNPHLVQHLLTIWSRAAAPSMAEYIGYENKALDDWLTALNEAHSLERRREALAAIHDLLSQDLPAIWLYHPYFVHAFSGRLQDIDHAYVGFSPSYALIRARLHPSAPRSN